MKTVITISQAIDGFLLAANARRLSQNTINDYQNTYRRFLEYLEDDPPLTAITTQDIVEFLGGLQVSKKTVLNYQTGLSALWTWAAGEELVVENIVHKIPRPSPEKKAVVPYSMGDIKAMIGSLNKSRSYRRKGKRPSDHTLPQTELTKAIIYLLLDISLRAS